MIIAYRTVAKKTFQPGSINYDGDIAARYPAARSFSAETATAWTTIVAPFLPRDHRATVLDLGCGTGRFAFLFADRFEVQVIGLDPAVAMLQAAAQGGRRDNLFYAVARSEQLPLSTSSCDLAWLSQMIHHVADRAACARELWRVIRPGGQVLIRGVFGDRLQGYPAYLRFFPRTRSIMEQFPTLDQVITDFRNSGFCVQGVETVSQKTCDSLAEFAARTRLRADSTLSLLSDTEFEKCQAALERAAREEDPTPVIETLDLLILQKPAS